MIDWAYAITYATIMVVCTIMLLPYTGKSDLWKSPLQRNLIPIIIAITTLLPRYDTLWLSIVHLQFFLPIAAILILFSEPVGKLSHYFRSTILCIAAMTGVTSACLAPFFVIKAWHAKRINAPDNNQTAQSAFIMCYCAAIQAIIVLYIMASYSSARKYGVNPLHIMHHITTNMLLNPVIEKKLLWHILEPLHPMVITVLIPTCFAAVLWHILSRKGRYLILILGYLNIFYFITATESNAKMLHAVSGIGYRYTVPTIALFTTVLMLNNVRLWSIYQNKKTRLLIAAFAIIMSYTMVKNMGRLQYPKPGSAWAKQVRRHHHKKIHKYAIISRTRIYNYCHPDICHKTRKHSLSHTLQIKGVPAYKRKNWQLMSGTIESKRIRKFIMTLPKISTSGEIWYRMRILSPDPGTLILRCDHPQQAPLIKSYKLYNKDRIISLPMHRYQNYETCRMRISSRNKGIHGITLDAYYDN